MKYLKEILGKLAGMSKVQLALAVSTAVVSIGTVSMAGYVTYGYEKLPEQMEVAQVIEEEPVIEEPVEIPEEIPEEEPEIEEELEEEVEEEEEIKELSLVGTSMEKDLKIKIQDQNGKLVAGEQFYIEVTFEKSGTKKEYNDHDNDGIIYIKELEAGKYSVTLKEIEGYVIKKGTVSVDVKAKIEYKKVDVTAEIKKESQVNTAVEDTAVKDVPVESTVTDTLPLLESKIKTSTVERKDVDLSNFTKAWANSKVNSATLKLAVTPTQTQTPTTTPDTTTPSTGNNGTTEDNGNKDTDVETKPEDGKNENSGNTNTGDGTDTSDKTSTGDGTDTSDKTNTGDGTDTSDKTNTGDGTDTSDKTNTGDGTDTEDKTNSGDGKSTSDNANVGAGTSTNNGDETNTGGNAEDDIDTTNTTDTPVPQNEEVPAEEGEEVPVVTAARSIWNRISNALTIQVRAAQVSTAASTEKTATISLPTDITLYHCDNEGSNTYKLTLTKSGDSSIIQSVKWKNTDKAVVSLSATSGETVTLTKKAKGSSNIFAEVTYVCDDKGNTTTASVKTTVFVVDMDDKDTVLKDKSGNTLYVDSKAQTQAKLKDYASNDTFYTSPKYTGWQTIDGKVFYYNEDHKAVTGKQVIGGVSYTFADDGSLAQSSGNRGIDVSKYQGNIDWAAVSASGINFAIIRAGYRGSSTGVLVEDPYFKKNIAGATKAGIKVGVYFFTQAITEAEAVEEASMALSLVSGYRLTYPIFIDTEAASNGRANGLSRSQRTAVVKAFCQTVQNGGHKAGIYASKSWFNNQLNASALSNYCIWVAQYSADCTYSGKYDMWQYTSKGTVSGIKGKVDMNISYTGY